KKETPV
nr:Chain B, KKETPV peptide ligand [synthetic construct]